MLGEANVVANVAVSDLEAAKKFYQNVLGLNQVDENPGGLMYEMAAVNYLFISLQQLVLDKLHVLAGKLAMFRNLSKSLKLKV